MTEGRGQRGRGQRAEGQKAIKSSDLELIISGGNRRWLESKMRDLADVWKEIIKSEQLLDITLSAGTKNNVFIFQNQTLNISLKMDEKA